MKLNDLLHNISIFIQLTKYGVAWDGTFWVDRNGNKWTYTHTKHNRVRAMNCAKSLNNCCGCINCFQCTLCVNCEECIGCVECLKCLVCHRCTKCITCHDCYDGIYSIDGFKNVQPVYEFE